MTKTVDDPKGTEAAIQNAIERGDFNDLRGKGKPLDLNDYFDTPEDIRLGYTLLKNAGYVPEEVQLLNQISELKENLIELKKDSALMKTDMEMQPEKTPDGKPPEKDPKKN